MSHWYTHNAEPMHYIDGRATTLRDARKLNLVPSVTTIIGSIDKPALNRWKERQVLLAALTLPKIENEPVDKFSERVMRDAFAESNAARDRGTEIHNAMERFFKTRAPEPWCEDIPHDIAQIALEAAHAVLDYCEYGLDHDFTAEQTIVGDGYGGTIDLNNSRFVIDYKGKDIKDGDWQQYLNSQEGLCRPPKFAWDEHIMQLAAYDKGLGGIPRIPLSVFIDRHIPGRVVIHQWTPEERELAWEKFRLLVNYWQLSKNYYPEAA